MAKATVRSDRDWEPWNRGSYNSLNESGTTSMSKLPESKIEKIKNQIQTWHNRAAMARQQGNFDLEKQALERAKEYENALARAQEFELD